MSKNLQSNIRKLRNRMGISQYEMAEKLGINRPRYSSYEEYRCEPNISLIIKLSEVFEVSIDDLIKKNL